MSPQKKSSPQAALLRALQKVGRAKCKEPDFLSLQPYRGTFGEAEAHTLYDRFAFGGKPSDINTAVSEGLDATVARLSSYNRENWLEAITLELNCDGRLFDNPNNEQCDPNDYNDFYEDGVRYGILYRMWYTNHPFRERLFMFLHDERMAAGPNNLGWAENHAFLKHIDMIRRAATVNDGDYYQFMRDWNEDIMGHFKWLDGDTNIYLRGYSPNENYAREFWELGTVGPTDLDGNPVYSDYDLAQASLAFTGGLCRVEEEEVNGETYYVGYCGSVSWRHAEGPKTIFNGTPYQAVVYDADDVLEATFRHPRLAEHLAEDIWKQFINPYATPSAIRRLAKIIRDNNYKLVPAFRTIMRSKAMFAERSRKSLIKHPVDLLIGFLRTTGIPYSYSRALANVRDMGQNPLLPPTVFGWNERVLAGERYTLEWRNTLLEIMTQGSESLENRGFTFYNRFLAGLPAQQDATAQVIYRISGELGVPVNSAQMATLQQYMNYNYNTCDPWDHCEPGQTYRLERELFDPAPDAEDNETKTRGVLTILAMLPEYRMK